MKKAVILVLILFFLFSFSSCKSKGISEHAIALRFGVDYSEGEYILSLKTVDISKSLEAKTETNVLTVRGSSVKEAFDSSKKYLEMEVYLLHIDSVILGMGVCENGIGELLYYLNDKEKIRLSTPFFVSDNALNIIYNGDDKIHSSDLVERVEVDGNKACELYVINRTLHEKKELSLPFLSCYLNENEKTYAVLDKQAFFSGDKISRIEQLQKK